MEKLAEADVDLNIMTAYSKQQGRKVKILMHETVLTAFCKFKVVYLY
jgi:hypothetical protein